MMDSSAATSNNRDLAAIPVSSIPSKLHIFFADTVCKVFDEFREPNSHPKEQAVHQCLTTPLQWMLCGNDPAIVFATLEQHATPSNFCGKVFKNGEPAYFCKDCQTDPTCCLCMECFEHSEHKDHRYRLFASGGGGCCDCGDPEAWTSEVYCQLHLPTKQNEDEVDPIESLPSDLVDRARVFFRAVLWYCIDVLTWQEPLKLPPQLCVGMTAESLIEDQCLAYLYNDEVHSYDEVIHTLTHNVKMTHTEAVSLATFIDRKGRAATKAGTEDDCLRCRELINTDLASPLNVHVFHVAVAAHQSNAILCLNLLKDLAEKVAGFRRLISQILVEMNSQRKNSKNILSQFFLSDSQLWITARITWHRLVMSSIFMDPVYKKQMAITLTENYHQLQKYFVNDSLHHDVCATNMSVQVFTVPSLSRMLVLENGLLQTILSTLLELLSPCKDPATGVLKLRGNNYKHSRLHYIMYDLRYVLRNKPEVWSERLRVQVMDAFNSMLELLGLLQNADPVKRQRGHHVEREDPWEHCFNFSIVLQPAVLLFVDWCCSDASLLCQAVTAAVKKNEVVAGKPKMLFKNHSCDRSLVGKGTMELIVFDIFKEQVSIHQPLPRVIASLLTGAHRHGLTIPQLLRVPPMDTRTPLFLMEHCCRAIVMAVQVMAGMWKRNGYSVVNQVINYQFHFSREFMYDRDILMLQAVASILEPSAFLYALIYKFRLEKWVASHDGNPTSRGESSEDALRFFISEAEDFVFLLIAVFSERYLPGVGMKVTDKDVLRREIIHRLYISPLSHSELVKQFRLKDNENEIDLLLKEIANLTRSKQGGGKYVFELKKEYEKEYNPFFYHYTRMDHSKAEDARRKKLKVSGASASRITPAPPPPPPTFTPPFQSIVRLTCCPIVHRVMHCVFMQAASVDSKFWSDKLLHETLYLCALMLSEENPTHSMSLCNAAMGRYGNHGFLEHLESLLNNRRAEEHRPLLLWVVQYLRNARDNGPGTPTNMSAESSFKLEQTDSAMEAASASLPQQKKNKELALARREKLMAQMSALQKKFLNEHKEELDEVDSGLDGESTTVNAPTGAPCCAVGVASLLDHTPTPVSVRCILCQEEAKDFAAQEKPFVQAVHVQRSAVLRKGSGQNESCDLLSGKADLSHGTFTSGCGHHMHAECWKRFHESKQQEHGRRHFFPIPGESVEWQSGEYLCPLCECYGNTVLPLLPHFLPSTSDLKLCRPCKIVTLSDWRELVAMTMELASSEDAMDTGSSVDPTLLDKLEELFPPYKKPMTHFSTSESSEDQRLLNTMEGLFTQAIYMRAYRVDPDESNERVCLSLWNNCIYTISSLERNSRYQDKFLLHADTLSIRQLDNVRSLVRLGCEPKIRPSVNTLAKYLQELVNSFLLNGPPFTELPSILEVDCFSMLVNLHFIFSSLFASLTTAYGVNGQLKGNPVIPALMGVTDQYLVQITAAACVIQYLLTCDPEENVESTADEACSSPELATGTGLRDLWLKYRKMARLPTDHPPSPYELYAGVQEYLYPFLQCTAFFFYCLSGIDFVYSSASLATRFEDLCQYIGLTPTVHTLFDTPTSSTNNPITKLAELWCGHPRIADSVKPPNSLPVLSIPRQMIKLPESFSDLVKRASSFKCPKRLVEGEDSQAAMLCLVCGEMLCTNSYCCQVVVGGGDGGDGDSESSSSQQQEERRIGGFNNHAQSCGAGIGLALWILESYVVLLDATDLQNVRGCTVTPPYLDEYGEPDPGLRRGSPQRLNRANYEELRLLWFHHRIPERICKEMEKNRGLMRINWSKM